jgi:transposase
MIEAITKCSAGLDVHKAMIVATILSEKENGELEETVKEFKTFPQDLANLARWLDDQKVESTMMESTGVYWKSVYQALEAQGLKVRVVNARHVKQTPGHKTDVADSKWLATLARFGLLKGSFIPPQDLRELRLLTRYRIKLKRSIASEVNRLHKVLDDGGIRLGVVISDLQSVSGKAIIDGLIDGEPIDKLLSYLKGSAKKKVKEVRACIEGISLSECHKLVLKKIRDHIKYLQAECEDLEKKIFTGMQPYKDQWQALQTIPGIDALSAAVIITEIGVDMQRFGSSEQLCSWAGMSPGNNESAGKSTSGKTTKGPPVLRNTLCEVANAAIRTRSQFQGYYKGLMIRRGHKRAVFAAGHKVLRVAHSLLTTPRGYKDPKTNYEELAVKRRAPRWVKALTKYGYIKLSVKAA